MIAKLKRVLGWVRDVWLILGIALALLVFIELLSSVRIRIPGRDSRSSADTYHNADWPKGYYKEDKASSALAWTSYVYWRRKPFHGQYINVDADGIRKTWQPAAGQGAAGRRPKIFFFGGSTMWGTGARDDYTIASIFAKRLSSKGIQACVTNYADLGYVSTQEMVALIRELQKGNIPDLVIFYDGANDTYSAFQQPGVGLPQNEYNRVKEFNASKHIAALFPDNLSTIRFFQRNLRRLGVGTRADQSASLRPADLSGLSKSQQEAVAKGVLGIYGKNIEMVQALAKRYSFKTLFYWQPTIYQKAQLSAYEARERQKHSDMQPFFDLTYGSLKQQAITSDAASGFHDLSRLFADKAEPLFVDWCHLGETGNAYVADQIAADALPILGGMPSADP